MAGKGEMVALFKKSKNAPSGALRLDGLLREMFGEVFHFDDENFWMGVNGSTVLSILYVEHSENVGSVHINAHVVRKVSPTPALCYDLLTNSDLQFTIGRWSIEADGESDGLYSVLLGADLVDEEGSITSGELGTVIGLLAETSDNIDEDLAARYGGKTAIDSLSDD
jgi:hypothetical protein